MSKEAGKIIELRDVNIIKVKVVKTPANYEYVENTLYKGAAFEFGKKVEKKWIINFTFLIEE